MNRLLLLLATLLPASGAIAAAPEITHTEPLGVVQGQTSTIRFYGPRLNDVHQAIVSDERLSVEKVEFVKNAVEVTFKCDSVVPCGMVAVQLVSKTGVTNVRQIGVGQFPIVPEVEPNGPRDPAHKLTPPCTVEGIVDREDVDRFEIQMAAGDVCKFEIEAIRLQFTLQNRAVLDPVIRITDADGFEVVSSDDNTLLRQDSLCSFTAPADGVYTIAVHESSFGGDKTMGGYRLHVGNFPRPVTVHPAAGTAGGTLAATLTDIDGSTRSVSLSLPSEPDTAFKVHDRVGDVSSPSPNVIRVEPHPVVVEPDGGQGIAKENAAAVPVTFCGVIEAGQNDRFYFDAKKNQSYWVTLFAREPFRSPLDGVLTVIDPAGKAIISNDDASGQIDSSVQFKAPADGVHQVVVRDHLSGGSPRHNYALVVTPTAVSLKIEAKEIDRDRSPTLAIPAGGHHAVVIRGTRTGHNDPVDVTLSGLPEGVTATTWPMPPGWSEIPVLLSATADAKLAGTTVSVSGVSSTNPAVRDDLMQHHKLVLGRNRREMIGLDLPDLTLAVTEPLPFEVSIDQPKTPIVRQGSKSLTARVVRHEGFEGEIYFRQLMTPPGIGINNSRKITAKEDSVEIPMTANSKAAVGTWPIILLARYNTPLGSREVATAAINLSVEEPIFGVKFGDATGQIGDPAIIPVTLTKLRDFDGVVSVGLAGLPRGVAGGQPREIKLEDQTVNFEVQLDDTAQPGLQKTVVLQTTVQRDGETIAQTDGGGTIRINRPPPQPQTDKPAEKPKPAAPKPLSRLEQLRQQKENAQ